MFWRRLLARPEGKQRQTHRGAFGKSFNSSIHYSQTVPSNRLAKDAVCRKWFCRTSEETRSTRSASFRNPYSWRRWSYVRLPSFLRIGYNCSTNPCSSQGNHENYKKQVNHKNHNYQYDNHTEYENHRTVGAQELESYCLFSSLRHLYPVILYSISVTSAVMFLHRGKADKIAKTWNAKIVLSNFREPMVT